MRPLRRAGAHQPLSSRAASVSADMKEFAEPVKELQLLDANGKPFHEKDNDKPFTMAIARDDLARIVGTATESLIRTLSDFKQEGLITIDGSRITIVEELKLLHLRG